MAGMIGKNAPIEMQSLHAADALLPSGWTRNVLLEWDESGMLTRVEGGQEPARHERAAGPLLPGMSNVHSHAFQRAMAGLAEIRGHPTDEVERHAVLVVWMDLSHPSVQIVRRFMILKTKHFLAAR